MISTQIEVTAAQMSYSPIRCRIQIYCEQAAKASKRYYAVRNTAPTQLREFPVMVYVL